MTPGFDEVNGASRISVSGSASMSGTPGDGAARPVTAQHADDAGAAEPGAHLQLGGVQALGDDLGGPTLVEGQLGVAMEVRRRVTIPSRRRVELLVHSGAIVFMRPR
jgi:hypothetical protein